MERIGFLINKLKEQYEKAESNDSMLITLQMLYRELMPKMDGNLAIGKISVMIPGQMDISFLEKSIQQKSALDLSSNREGKQVFELSLEPKITTIPIEQQLVVEKLPIEKQPLLEVTPIEQPPIVANIPVEKTPDPALKQPQKHFFSALEFQRNPFVTVATKLETPVSKPEPVVAEKPTEQQDETPKNKFSDEANVRYMPQELKPKVEQPVIQPYFPFEQPQPTKPIPTPPDPPKLNATVVPAIEVHESLQKDNQPTLNEIVEKRQPELFNILKSEPLKDLKKAISINERFQYINYLFMKDEAMYERSLKTINSFNVFSEAHFWIRKELATKMGWDNNDEVVQQFMNLVERRFL